MRGSLPMTEEDRRLADLIRRSSVPDQQWDEFVMGVFKEVKAKIDCATCGECCRKIHVTFDESDSERMAGHLGMEIEVFIDRYFTRIGPGERDIMKERPCAFQEGNLCIHYEWRGQDCRGFPYLDQPGFRERLTSLLYVLEICPIVKEVWGRVKDSHLIQLHTN